LGKEFAFTPTDYFARTQKSQPIFPGSGRRGDLVGKPGRSFSRVTATSCRNELVDLANQPLGLCMAESVTSKNGIPIRLTDERWLHITEEHAELADYRLEVLEAIREADRIVAGTYGELLAMKNQPDGKILVGCIVSAKRMDLLSPHF
jgi:hypothetical protein